MINNQEATPTYYTYAVYNDEWGVPFYVGKGTGNRYMQMDARSIQFTAITSAYACHSEIIQEDLTEIEAYTAEDELKKEYILRGYPIIDWEVPGRITNQRIGIEKAKRQGKYEGRTPIAIDEKQFKSICAKWRNGEITARDAMKALDLKPNTFYRNVKRLGL